jgi:hypothetical protein
MGKSKHLEFNMSRELSSAYRYSVALRRLLGTDMEPLTDDHPLCQWDGPLLPIEPLDREAEHGSERGYQQHRARKEPACEVCVRAHTLYNKQRKDAKKAAC